MDNGVDEIGLMDAQVVAFPVSDLLSGSHRTHLILTQDSSNAVPGNDSFSANMDNVYF